MEIKMAGMKRLGFKTWLAILVLGLLALSPRTAYAKSIQWPKEKITVCNSSYLSIREAQDLFEAIREANQANLDKIDKIELEKDRDYVVISFKDGSKPAKMLVRNLVNQEPMLPWIRLGEEEITGEDGSGYEKRKPSDLARIETYRGDVNEFPIYLEEALVVKGPEEDRLDYLSKKQIVMDSFWVGQTRTIKGVTWPDLQLTKESSSIKLKRGKGEDVNKKNADEKTRFPSRWQYILAVHTTNKKSLERDKNLIHLRTSARNPKYTGSYFERNYVEGKIIHWAYPQADKYQALEGQVLQLDDIDKLNEGWLKEKIQFRYKERPDKDYKQETISIAQSKGFSLEDAKLTYSQPDLQDLKTGNFLDLRVQIIYRDDEYNEKGEEDSQGGHSREWFYVKIQTSQFLKDRHEPKKIGDKILVDDPKNLTIQEKENLKEAFFKANQGHLPENIQLEVGQYGQISVIYADGSVDLVAGEDLIEEDLLLRLELPEKIEVQDPKNLKKEEIRQVKKALLRANKDLGLKDEEIFLDSEGNIYVSRGNKRGSLQAEKIFLWTKSKPSKENQETGPSSPLIIWRAWGPENFPRKLAIQEPIPEKAKDRKEFFPYLFGYPDGSLRPDAQVTRAEAASILAQVLDLDLSNTAKPDFLDTPSAWYNGAIHAVMKKELFLADLGGNFRPQEAMTRGELARALHYMDPKVTSESQGQSPFKDIKDHPFEKYIQEAYWQGLVKGYPDGSFQADSPLSRAELVKIINSYRGIHKAQDLVVNRHIKLGEFKDLNPNHWAYYDLILANQGS